MVDLIAEGGKYAQAVACFRHHVRFGLDAADHFVDQRLSFTVVLAAHFLPDAVIVAEGGYEARGLVADIGFYSPKAQDVVVQAVRQMAAEAGRILPK